jgi:beta-phosphoglucomutase family hydrolase
MLERFTAIIFDMDGTLVDSGKLHEHAWSETLRKYSIPIDYALMRSLAGVPTKETIVHLSEHFGCPLEASLDEMNSYKEEIVRRVYIDYVKPTKLLSVVDTYFGKKPMSIGTGAYTGEARKILTACNLLDKMDHVVGADQVSNPKPAPDTFLLCAELMKVKPSECVVFEDSKTGLDAARSAGMVGIDVLQQYGIVNDYFLKS